jgi:ketosteroid isomerase-like protein
MRQFLSVTAVSLLLALGCAPAAGPPAQEVDLEAERASVMEADRAFFEAVSTSDSPLDTLSAHMMDNANVLPPDAPMARGKEESLAVFAALQALPGYSLRWSALTGDVGSAGDLGYTIGSYHMEFQDPEGDPVEIDGKYMTVWKKQSDGSWKIAVDMFNAN